MLVLATLRQDQRAADLAVGNQIAESTMRRWRDEIVVLLAAEASRLDRATLYKIARRGGEVVGAVHIHRRRLHAIRVVFGRDTWQRRKRPPRIG